MLIFHKYQKSSSNHISDFHLIIEAHFQEVKHMSKEIVPVAEKYLITINEAASYFNIGAKKMRRIAEEYTGEFSLYSGNRLLINTHKI